MNKAVIFDFDGTIFDTLADIAENVNLTLAKYNKPLRTNEEIKTFIGCGAKNLIALSFDEDVKSSETDEHLAYYNKVYTASKSEKSTVFDGMMDVLYALKDNGFKIAILTNKPQATTERIIKTHISEFPFDMVVGQSDNVKCKPDKTATLNILKALDVLPENTFFVGDGETDVLTAINSNTKGVAVLWGYRSKEQLEKVGAKVFASSPKELLKILLS